MEKFTQHCASLSSSSSSKKSRFNFAIVVSTLLAAICFLTLRFSPSFLSLLLLIPSFLFLTHKKSHSSPDPLTSAVDHHLFDELPPRTAEERSAAVIGEDVSSDDESGRNGGLGSSGDFDHHLFDEMPQRTAEGRSAAPIGEDISSDDESISNSVDLDSDLWMCFDEPARNPPFSDDSCSEDDDSLIEIPLLTNSSGEVVRNVEMCLPDLLTESVLKQHRFMKLLEEINEEDNLIEIDISRGFNPVSTACN